MQRRRFLSSLAASAVISPLAKAAEPGAREYYELRKYKLHSGPQQKLTNQYLAEALIPGLNRLGMKPIGAFNLELGPETPTVYVLVPSTSLETLVMSESRLVADDEYMKAGEPFLTAPPAQLPFDNMESSLMVAFEGWPKLVVPPPTAQKGQRVFQLRTYYSPNIRDHQRKLEMFHSGEFEFFRRAGLWEVFYGDKLIGNQLPNLTYMLSFPTLEEMNAKWKAFSSDPDWKKLTSSPKYNFEPIVTNVDNLILNPTSYSQI